MKYFYIMYFALLSVFANAQISDTEAKILYQQAEDAYNSNDFLKALTLSKNLEEKMGKKLHKVTYILLKSYNKCLENNLVDKNYKDLDYHFTAASDFLNSLDKSSYPIEKYKEIENIQISLSALRMQYSAQKDRTPQDAIDFLNECAQKFPTSVLLLYGYDAEQHHYLSLLENGEQNWSTSYGAFKKYELIKQHNYVFSLEGTKLSIHWNTEKDKARRFDQWFLVTNCFQVDLSDVNLKLENFVIKSHDKNPDFTSTGLTSSIIYDEGAKKFSHLKRKYHLIERKKLSDLTDLIKKYPDWSDCSNPKYMSQPLQIFQFFGKNQEFNELNYEKRIREAFEFLINFFPKTQIQQQKQSKF